MGFFGISDEFYILTETTPSYPFPQLPDIVSRSKYLLKKRSRKEILSAANTIDWFVEEYFYQCKEECIQDILINPKSSNNWVLRYLPCEGITEEGIRNVLDNFSPPPCISSDNTTELTALRECIGRYSLDDDEDFPNGREFEYFAVLALRQVGKSIMSLPSRQINDLSTLSTARRNMIELSELLDKVIEPISPGMTLARAGTHALDAMDAICYAEHLRATEKQNEELENLRIALHQASQNTDAIVEDKLKKKISLAASHASIKRHAKSAELRNMAIKLYLTQTWPSVRQASKNIFPQLIEPGDKIGFVFSPDRGEQTVYEWLLAASKEIRKQADV